MMKMKYSQVSALACVLALGGCMSQKPVDVVSGYETHGQGTHYASESNSESYDFLEKPKTSGKYYHVSEGDTLAGISGRYNISVAELRQANQLLSSEEAVAGQVLSIPTSGGMSGGSQLASAQPSSTNSGYVPTVRTSSSKPYRLTDKYKQPETKETWVAEGVSQHKQQEALAAADKVLKMDMNAVEPAAGPKNSEVSSAMSMHTVRAGENIYRIGLKYGVSQFDIMAANDIANPSDLKVGAQLKIPSEGQEIVAPTVREAQKTAEVRNEVKKFLSKKRHPKTGLVWPAEGEIVKEFGQAGEGVNNTGVNILLPENAPVVAVADGTVIYSDSGLESYGNLILVRHKNGMVTAYAHNAKNLVAKSTEVKQGEVIAYAGNSGNVEQTQLHFEVRRKAKAINPMQVLPKL